MQMLARALKTVGKYQDEEESRNKRNYSSQSDTYQSKP